MVMITATMSAAHHLVVSCPLGSNMPSVL